MKLNCELKAATMANSDYEAVPRGGGGVAREGGEHALGTCR